MALFSKNKIVEPIVYKDSNQATLELQKIQELLKNNKNEELERKAKLIHYGIEGEKNILFELKNSHMPMYILHDIYIEHNDLSAQIDYIIITRSQVYFIECKNLIGTINIDHNGNFTREYTINGRKIKEGIYSPITQNRRHLDLYKKLRLSQKGKISATLFDKTFDTTYHSLIVLANPKSILNDKYAPKEIKQKVIKADQLIDYLKKHETKDSLFSYDAMLQFVENLMNYHIDKEPNIIKEDIPVETTTETIDKEQTISDDKKSSIISKLKSYRLSMAKEQNIPPYYIFNDAALDQLIQLQPKTIEELLLVKGFGPKKCEIYGEEILNILSHKK